MTISPSHRFVWYRVAKVGTRTILGILDDAEVKHFSSDDVLRSRFLYTSGRYRFFFTFAFVRNPWDRLVSCWANKVVDNNYFRFSEGTLASMRSSFPMFADWACAKDLTSADRHIALMSSLIDLDAVEFIGRMERFDADLDVVCRRIGLQHGRKEPRNVSVRGGFRDYYDGATRQLVGDAYAPDIERFGYTFD